MVYCAKCSSFYALPDSFQDFFDLGFPSLCSCSCSTSGWVCDSSVYSPIWLKASDAWLKAASTPKSTIYRSTKPAPTYSFSLKPYLNRGII